jgi:hypothetical protein
MSSFMKGFGSKARKGNRSSQTLPQLAEERDSVASPTVFENPLDALGDPTGEGQEPMQRGVSTDSEGSQRSITTPTPTKAGIARSPSDGNFRGKPSYTPAKSAP